MPDVGVSELFRFRTVRAISHIDASRTAYVIPELQLPPAITPLLTVLGQYNWLLTLSTTLALSADYLTPQQVTALLPQDWQAQLAQKDQNGHNLWDDVRGALHTQIVGLAAQCRAIPPVQGAYGVSVVPPELASEVEEYCRALLVLDLVATLAQVPCPLVTAQDVQTALTFRNVSLPRFNPNQPVLARQPGVTDLSIVKDEWNRYVPGEIANVVNVLPGETLDEKTTHLDETDTTTSTTNQQTTSETTANSQTTSQTLSQTASSTASTTIGAHAQVEIQGGWGPMQIKSNIGAQVQTSQSSSQSLSRTTAIQTVASAVKTVSQTVIQSQTTRTKTKDTDFREHKLQNTTTNPSVHPYLWLSVVHRCQVVQYPHRLVLEFEIPEPGYWLRWALTNQPDTPWSNPDPGLFTIDGNPLAADGSNAISPGHITQEVANYLAFRWRIQGLTSPPIEKITLGQAYSVGGGGPLSDNSLAIPDTRSQERIGMYILLVQEVIL
jgi:hypothetical protein